MTDIVITPLRAEDRPRWSELWRGYLEFYETALPEAIYEETWRRLMTPGPIFGLGARFGDATAPLVGTPTICSTTTSGRQSRSATCRICSSMRASAAPAAGAR